MYSTSGQTSDAGGGGGSGGGDRSQKCGLAVCPEGEGKWMVVRPTVVWVLPAKDCHYPGNLGLLASGLGSAAHLLYDLKQVLFSLWAFVFPSISEGIE